MRISHTESIYHTACVPPHADLLSLTGEGQCTDSSRHPSPGTHADQSFSSLSLERKLKSIFSLQAFWKAAEPLLDPLRASPWMPRLAAEPGPSVLCSEIHN